MDSTCPVLPAPPGVPLRKECQHQQNNIQSPYRLTSFWFFCTRRRCLKRRSRFRPCFFLLHDCSSFLKPLIESVEKPLSGCNFGLWPAASLASAYRYSVEHMLASAVLPRRKAQNFAPETGFSIDSIYGATD